MNLRTWADVSSEPLSSTGRVLSRTLAMAVNGAEALLDAIGPVETAAEACASTKATVPAPTRLTENGVAAVAAARVDQTGDSMPVERRPSTQLG